MHHSRVAHQLTVPIDPSCSGRRFRLSLVTRQVASLALAKWRLDEAPPYGAA